MINFLPVTIGLRYARAKRSNHFISFISFSSIAGLALGVMVLITVLSVMNGFDRELRERILGMVPHATLWGNPILDDWQETAKLVEKMPNVVAVAPHIQAQVMFQSGDSVHGAILNGINPDMEKKVSIIDDNMASGSLDALKDQRFGIVLGAQLARQLRVSIGDKVTAILPKASVSIAGVAPVLKRFTLVGTFEVGAELDSSLAYINITDAAKLKRYQAGSVEALRISFNDLFVAPTEIWDIARAVPGQNRVSDWTRTHGNLFQAIKMEKTMIGLLLLLIVAVAAFNIVSTLVMVVTDKRNDIAILRTMGLTSTQVMWVFIVQGMFIGMLGTLIGVILGVSLALNVSDIIAAVQTLLGVQFLSADVYFINYLPSQLEWSDVELIVTSAFIMTVVATIYPAWRASKVEPAEALRYE
ncbi:lipoprotein-releasing ABC transporter permease subunit [Marinomonas posidonica]|uniref:Lipoprotein releasing system, transmembrane protein, LolC/E family n=1 Tax=Marinomonas posidonica (strain CECT 7376 / NCIMB 14433 / IVIA-Po-181) TaxID=491952 RepID=F6D174_MARPP|nr:lipoprotein-releasing ABC transporter permease subunit [Marinomonas posidonica]AEF54881.1 lipoprotein releasing system, transmembrane protein, LolC/E family [Marinomonas posidonica IVIA-Po-181]